MNARECKKMQKLPEKMQCKKMQAKKKCKNKCEKNASEEEMQEIIKSLQSSRCSEAVWAGGT